MEDLGDVLQGLCAQYAASRNATERRRILKYLPVSHLVLAKQMALLAEVKVRHAECQKRGLRATASSQDLTSFVLVWDGGWAKFKINSNGNSVPADPKAWAQVLALDMKEGAA
jgi:hypothetical protein